MRLKLRLGTCLLALVAAGSAARSQEQAPATPAMAEDLAAIESQAGADVEGALAALERLAAEPARARDAALLRPRVLLRAGRRDEAREAWRLLLARGEDVGAPLLADAGATLEVRIVGATPGASLALRLAGARTGPLELRLYSIAGGRLRAALDAEPGRGLWAHLRAPPPAALTRRQQWSLADGPAGDADVMTTSPRPLDPGPHLLVVTARGVPVAIPVLVPDARAVVCGEEEGARALWVVERAAGAPIPDLEVRRLLGHGVPGPALGATDARGLWRGLDPLEPATLLLWPRDGEPLVVEVPPAGAASPAASDGPIEVVPPVARPGGRVVASAPGPPGLRANVRLVDPRGVAVASRTVEVDRTGQVAAAFDLPEDGLPGAWRVVVDGRAAALEVQPPLARDVTLELEAPAVATPGGPAGGEGGHVVARVRGRLAGGAPLVGRVVRFAARRAPADAGLADARERLVALGREAPGAGPLPRFAPRPTGAWVALAEGTLVLDARGEATLDLALPAPAGPGLVEVAAALRCAPTAPDRAAARAWTSHGPRDLLLSVGPARPVVAPLEAARLIVAGAHLDGRPAALADLRVTVRRAGQEGAPLLERDLRLEPDGLAFTDVLPDAPGRLLVEVTGRDEDGRRALATCEVQVVLRLARRPDEVAPADATRLEVHARAAEPGAPAGPTAVVVRAPFAEGHALVATDAGPPVVVALRAGQAEVEVPAGARLVVARAARDGELLEARTTRAAPPRPLVLEAHLAPPARGENARRRALSVRVEGPRAEGEERAARPGVAALLAGEVLSEATARLLAHGAGPRRDDALPPGSRERHDGVLVWPLLEALGGATSGANGLGLGTLVVPGPRAGRAWARVRARDARGGRGEGWVELDATPALEALASGPAHLVEGDQVEVAALLLWRPARLAAAPPAGAVVRVTWRAEGVDVGAPRVSGTRPVLLGDPGPGSLRLEPQAEMRVALPLAAPARGGPSPDLRGAWVEVAVEVEGSAIAAITTWRATVRPRGLVESTSLGGVVAPGGVHERVLEPPAGALAGTGRLVIVGDPEPITAALAGLRALAPAPPAGVGGDAPGGPGGPGGGPGEPGGIGARGRALHVPGPQDDLLRAPLQRALGAHAVRAALVARRLRPPGDAAAPLAPGERAAMLARLSARRDDAGGWGARTASLTLALLRMRACGEDVPAALVDPALALLAARPLPAGAGRDQDGRPLLARALAGPVPGLEAVPPAALDADGRVFLAVALLAAGHARRAEEVLAAAAAAVDELATTEAAAELLHLLVLRRELPALRDELTARLLARREGPGWRDADDAGAAVRALAALAALEPEAPACQATARLEGAKVLDAWSGGGLERWPEGPGGAAGSAVARRARLVVQAEGPRPVTWSARIDALVARDHPAPVLRGLQLGRRLLRAGAAGLEPTPAGGVEVGDELRLVVTLDAPPDTPALRDLLVELPLPAGCVLLRRPPDSRLEAGVLLLALDDLARTAELVLDLLAVSPGDSRLLPARARATRGPERVATTDELVLRIRIP